MPPPALVRAMEERSGYKWEDVQAALARVWVGDHADPDEEKKVQKIEIQEAARGEALKQDEQQKDKVQKMTTVPKTTKEALDIIEKWENSCPTDAPKIQPSISHLCMDTPEKVKDQPWYGSEKEEVASYVTEIAYIHRYVALVLHTYNLVTAQADHVPQQTTDCR